MDKNIPQYMALIKTVDCGFIRLPANSQLETIFLKEDRYLVVLPEGHPLAEYERVPVSALCDYPFMLLDKEGMGDVAQILEDWGISPNIRFTTWDDYAIMAMVESGLGIGILPELILQRVPYRIEIRPLDMPAYRQICLGVRDKKTTSLAVKRFMEYLPYRQN